MVNDKMKNDKHVKNKQILRLARIVFMSAALALTSCGDREQYNKSRAELANAISAKMELSGVQNVRSFTFYDRVVRYSGYRDNDRTPCMSIYDGILVRKNGDTLNVSLKFKIDDFTCFYLSEDKQMSNDLFILDDLPEITKIVNREDTVLYSIRDMNLNEDIFTALSGDEKEEETKMQTNFEMVH